MPFSCFTWARWFRAASPPFSPPCSDKRIHLYYLSTTLDYRLCAVLSPPSSSGSTMAALFVVFDVGRLPLSVRQIPPMERGGGFCVTGEVKVGSAWSCWLYRPEIPSKKRFDGVLFFFLPFFSEFLPFCTDVSSRYANAKHPPSFHPSIPPPSFQNTHARRFERAKSIERCQRARGLEDSRDVSDRTLFFLPSFLIFLSPYFYFFFVFFLCRRC